jgi:putative membrane protein insertion efficiency factor
MLTNVITTPLISKLFRIMSVMLILIGFVNAAGHADDGISASARDTQIYMRNSSYESDKRAESVFYDQTNPISMLLVAIINVYQRVFSAQEGSATCQFRPSCSHFGALAIKKYGAVQGTLMTGDRMLRCNPWAQGSYPLWEDNLHYHDTIEEHDLWSSDTL